MPRTRGVSRRRGGTRPSGGSGESLGHLRGLLPALPEVLPPSPVGRGTPSWTGLSEALADFRGGLNVDKDPALIGPTQLVEAQNVFADERGLLTRRDGFRRVIDRTTIRVYTTVADFTAWTLTGGVVVGGGGGGNINAPFGTSGTASLVIDGAPALPRWTAFNLNGVGNDSTGALAFELWTGETLADVATTRPADYHNDAISAMPLNGTDVNLETSTGDTGQRLPQGRRFLRIRFSLESSAVVSDFTLKSSEGLVRLMAEYIHPDRTVGLVVVRADGSVEETTDFTTFLTRGTGFANTPEWAMFFYGGKGYLVNPIDGLWRLDQDGDLLKVGRSKAVVQAGGALAAGFTYQYKFTFTWNAVEHGYNQITTAPATSAGNQTIALTKIPLGPFRTTVRNLYRNRSGAPAEFRLVTGAAAALANNTTTAFTDATADDNSANALFPAALPDFTMPAGSTATVYHERAFIGGLTAAGGRSDVIGSDLTDPENWFTEGEQFLLPVDRDDGQFVTSILAVLDQILVHKTFKSRSIIGLTDTASFRKINLSEIVGCPHPHTVKELMLKDRRVIAVWLGHDNVYAFDGSGVFHVGDAVRTILRDAFRSTITSRSWRPTLADYLLSNGALISDGGNALSTNGPVPTETSQINQPTATEVSPTFTLNGSQDGNLRVLVGQTFTPTGPLGFALTTLRAKIRLREVNGISAGVNLVFICLVSDETGLPMLSPVNPSVSQTAPTFYSFTGPLDVTVEFSFAFTPVPIRVGRTYNVIILIRSGDGLPHPTIEAIWRSAGADVYAGGTSARRNLDTGIVDGTGNDLAFEILGKTDRTGRAVSPVLDTGGGISSWQAFIAVVQGSFGSVAFFVRGSSASFTTTTTDGALSWTAVSVGQLIPLLLTHRFVQIRVDLTTSGGTSLTFRSATLEWQAAGAGVSVATLPASESVDQRYWLSFYNGQLGTTVAANNDLLVLDDLLAWWTQRGVTGAAMTVSTARLTLAQSIGGRIFQQTRDLATDDSVAIAVRVRTRGIAFGDFRRDKRLRAIFLRFLRQLSGVVNVQWDPTDSTQSATVSLAPPGDSSTDPIQRDPAAVQRVDMNLPVKTAQVLLTHADANSDFELHGMTLHATPMAVGHEVGT